MKDLPIEIWLNIFKHLKFKDLISLQQVNRDFNHFFNVYKWMLFDEIQDSRYINNTKDKSLIFIPKNLETFLSYEYIIDITTILNNEHIIPDETIDNLNRYINFPTLSNKQTLSDDILRKYWNQIPTGQLLQKQKLPIDVLIQMCETLALTRQEWKELCRSQKLTYDFIVRFEQDINWNMLSMNKESLTGEVLERYMDRLIIHEITKHGINSIILKCFIEKIDRISWINISYHSKLNDEFVSKYIDFLDPSGLLMSQDLSCDTITKIINHHEKDGYRFDLWQHAATHQSLNIDFIKSNVKNLNRAFLVKNRKIKRSTICEFDRYLLEIEK